MHWQTSERIGPGRKEVAHLLSPPKLQHLLLCVFFLLLAEKTSANPPVGNFTALIVLVQFPNHISDRVLPDPSYFQELCDTRIKSYFSQQSYGKYNIEKCVVQPWKFTFNTESFYAEGVANQKGPDYSVELAVPVLDAWDEDETFDWGQFDANNDGDLDAVLILHSGYGAEQRQENFCGAADPADRIQSQGFNASTAWVGDSGIKLSGWAMASAFETVCSDQPATMGVMVHEWLHSLGAEDVYDTGVLNLESPQYGGIASFDIMANPFGSVNGNLPGSLSPYSKILVQWLEPQEILYDGLYEIQMSNLYPEAYIIRKGYAPGEYLLIENRQTIDIDAQLPGNGGLLIYHIDEQVLTQDAPGWPGSPFWPFDHYRVALLQADGNYDLEKGINNGDRMDYYSANSQQLLPGGQRNYPNTDSYQFGELTSTGISIVDISKSAELMTFRVQGLGAAPEPEPETTPAPMPTMSNDTPTAAPGVAGNSPPTTPTIPIISSSRGTITTHSTTTITMAAKLAAFWLSMMFLL